MGCRCGKTTHLTLNGLKDSIIDHDIASMDALTLQVLNDPRRNPTTQPLRNYFCGSGDKKTILYEYKEKEHKPFVKDGFEGFSGAVHSDADSFFGAL